MTLKNNGDGSYIHIYGVCVCVCVRARARVRSLARYITFISITRSSILVQRVCQPCIPYHVQHRCPGSKCES